MPHDELKTRKVCQGKKGMTLIEILIVTSLLSLVSLAIYNSLANGIKVWERSRQVVVEEDVVIFFDKVAQDLRNTFFHSKINFKGTEFKFSFPTIVYTPADRRSGASEGEYIEQMGRVEYYYDFNEDTLYRHQANYSQALNERFGRPRALVTSVDRIKFRYYYRTDTDEIYTPEILDVLPSGVEIEVEFSDNQGQKIMKKFIDIPIES